jgi:putative membrane-bound dehydrogenase-like protein
MPRNYHMFKVLSLSLVGLFGAVMATPPVLKTGACPTFTRSAPASGDNWGQFPIKPTTAFVTANCSGAACTQQDPLPTNQSINCIQVPSGLRAELVASELTPGPAPSLGYLMYISFDERGRVWAAEPRDYPAIANDPNPTNRITGGKGRILILEDTDGDGSLDNYKVFYDGLVMPTSLEVVNGGVIATVEPLVVFLPKSTTNPDTAGAPITLFSGMGSTGNTWDTHGGTNSITSGLDNWYYGHLGYNGGCSVNGVTCATGGVWRFRHTAIGSLTTTFQAFSTSGPANAHGVGQMEDGQIFQSGATGTPHNNHAIRRGVAAVNIQVNGTYYPITGDRYLWEGSTGMTNGQFTSNTTASSGHDFYTARLLPQKYWNTRSFVCEGASKLCNQDSMVINGSTWTAARMPGPVTSNIFASSDAWVAPIKVRTGPDGGLWVVDWHNYLFLHNPATPANNAAWNNALRTKTRTRLYRIVPDDGHTDPVLNLSNATTAQLVATLYHSNFVWRMQAQRLLIGKGYTAELGDSLQSILTNHKTVDAVGIDGAVIHAIWTLEGLNRFVVDSTRWAPILKSLLLHPAWGVRENVLKAMPRTATSAQAISDQCAADDPHAHVRLQAYVALAESPAATSGAVQGHYRATDTYSSSAFDAAGASKLAAATPANTRPTSCPDIQSTVALSHGSDLKNTQMANPMRFTMTRNGFELDHPYGKLSSGDLVVYDITGKAAFRSSYNSATEAWSTTTAKGLNMSVYFYSFHGTNGDKFEGRLLTNQEF